MEKALVPLTARAVDHMCRWCSVAQEAPLPCVSPGAGGIWAWRVGGAGARSRRRGWTTDTTSRLHLAKEKAWCCCLAKYVIIPEQNELEAGKHPPILAWLVPALGLLVVVGE